MTTSHGYYAMLIGAHVSPAGGPAKAVERGVERGCRSIQIFNQSPRMWRRELYTDEQLAAYRGGDRRLAASTRVLIHAVYLLNPASDDPEIREKSLTSLTTSAARRATRSGAAGVVLHPGSAQEGRGRPGDRARRRADRARRSRRATGCPLHLEDTAGAGGTLGRSFDELAALLNASGGGERLGICLDSCHLLASGYDVRTIEGVDEVLDASTRRSA